MMRSRILYFLVSVFLFCWVDTLHSAPSQGEMDSCYLCDSLFFKRPTGLNSSVIPSFIDSYLLDLNDTLKSQDSLYLSVKNKEIGDMLLLANLQRHAVDYYRHSLTYVCNRDASCAQMRGVLYWHLAYLYHRLNDTDSTRFYLSQLDSLFPLRTLVPNSIFDSFSSLFYASSVAESATYSTESYLQQIKLVQEAVSPIYLYPDISIYYLRSLRKDKRYSEAVSLLDSVLENAKLGRDTMLLVNLYLEKYYIGFPLEEKGILDNLHEAFSLALRADLLIFQEDVYRELEAYYRRFDMKDSLYAMILHRVNHSDSLYGLYSSIGFFLSNSYLLSNNQTSLQKMKSKEAQQKRINVILLTGLMAIFVVFPVIVLCVFFVYIFFRHLNNVAIGNSQRQKKQVINRKRLELDFFLQEMMCSKNKGVLIRKDLATTRKDSLVYATFLMSGTFYALTLQEFLYPNLEEIQEHYPNIFFISRPKEVVSSDLVFAKIYNNQLFLILSYCPFHGVAGASLIFVQYMILNKLVIELNLTDEQSIVKLFLSDLYDLLFNPSTQSPIELYRPDLAFFSHILHSSEVSYVGLNMNLYELKHSHAENGQCQIHEATVFGGEPQNDVEIKLHSIDLTVPSLFYMTTRGVYSQKNVDDEEFTENMFVDTLCSLLSFPLLEQPPLLMNEFFAFRGGREQDDDLTLVGLQIE